MQNKTREEIGKRSGGADQDHGEAVAGGPHEGGTGELPGKPSHPGQRLLHP